MGVAKPICRASGAILAVAIPTLAVEESWHGKPLIDQGSGWVVPAAIVTVAFVGGGALAARWSRGRLGAGLASGALAAVLLALADVVRRLFVTHQHLYGDVAILWLIAGGGAAVLSGATGAVAAATRRGR
jgi:peptidoglycan/LPS O-acetylase OafA/YrhL